MCSKKKAIILHYLVFLSSPSLFGMVMLFILQTDNTEITFIDALQILAFCIGVGLIPALMTALISHQLRSNNNYRKWLWKTVLVGAITSAVFGFIISADNIAGALFCATIGGICSVVSCLVLRKCNMHET